MHWEEWHSIQNLENLEPWVGVFLSKIGQSITTAPLRRTTCLLPLTTSRTSQDAHQIMNIFRSAIFILALARNLYVVEANLFPFNCVVDGPWIGENAACQSINPDPVTRDYKYIDAPLCKPPETHRYCCDATIYDSLCCPSYHSYGGCTTMNGY
ncbi:hypothetical protein H4Q26_000688 [Puccinia striiformis f. sp. tritici PST-130]|uniref:Uncharacterized protein n=1 Tax=Puccinia striiformis TaxID=27350 RepID=A0A2S4VQG0_9BASI|nr:hypothetical protein H4Q26_000688 [Puccinia striiformis f. sp. tritici PST-130]POW11620.1 hypothetical protein PSTT_05109 [Puccinia striiformis]